MTLPRCLVVGVDASPESLAALDLALALADRLDARLVVVHAVGLLEEGGYRARPDLAEIVEDARQRVGAGTPRSTRCTRTGLRPTSSYGSRSARRPSCSWSAAGA